MTMHSITKACSPWGVVQESETIAPGIVSVSTASHGGIHLDRERQAALKRRFPGFSTYAGGPWYEEDEDVAVVALAFPHKFTAPMLRGAVHTVEHHRKPWRNEPYWIKSAKRWACVVRWLDGDHTEALTIRDTVQLFDRLNANRWERGSMGTYGGGGWRVSLKRVRDKARREVVFRDYPMKQFYSDSELAELSAEKAVTA